MSLDTSVGSAGLTAPAYKPKHLGPSAVSAVLGYGFETPEELRTRLETGRAIEMNSAIQLGLDYEKTALRVYAKYTGLRVFPAYFVKDPLLPRFGGRGDALIWPDNGEKGDKGDKPIGGVEIKCTRRTPTVYFNHKLQAVSYMHLYKTSWWDVVCYNPDTRETVMERIEWKDFEHRWTEKWYPAIREFIENVAWAT